MKDIKRMALTLYITRFFFGRNSRLKNIYPKDHRNGLYGLHVTNKIHFQVRRLGCLLLPQTHTH